MNKILSSILLTILLLSFVSCSTTQDSDINDINTTDDIKESAIDPSKTESITISSFVLDLIGADPVSGAEAYSVNSIIKNEDSSVTYYLTPAEKTEILAQMRSSLNSHLDSFINSTDHPFVKDISINADYNTVTITSTQTEFLEARDSVIAPSIYIPVITYVAFSQAEYKELSDFVLNFTVINETDGSVLGSFSYPSEETLDDNSSSQEESQSDDENASNESSESEGEKELPGVNRGDDIP